MELTDADLMLVTGATGLVGSHVVEEVCRRGIRVRALARPGADTTLLKECGAEIVPGDMTDTLALRKAAEGATLLVHCAAKVGDWGAVESYRKVNVRGLENLLAAASEAGSLRKMVHISSLGVYPARDHHGTDESTAPSTAGIDGYTLTKVEAEQVVRRYIDERKLPAVMLRPGFIYGPRDRTVLPRLLEKIKSRQFKFLGSPEKLMNNTYVGNLVAAIFLALENDAATGQVFNVTDGRLVSKREFVHTAAEQAGYKKPTGTVPLPVAKGLAATLEGLWKLLGKQEAPLLSGARIKFLGLNLDFSTAKARRELGYDPQVDFTEGMRRTIDWFRQHDRLP